MASIVLNAPQRRNAITIEMANELVDVCDRIDDDASVGAVVVSGAGGYFCAGVDRGVLAGIADEPTTGPARDRIRSVYRAFVRVGLLRPPTIAAITGGAVGAGLNLALATDLRLMAADARLDSGFARLGIHPGGGHFALFGRVAGRDAVAAVSIFGEAINGARAEQIGLAWRALPTEEVQPRAFQLAAQVASDPALARRAIASLRQELGPPPLSSADGLEIELEAQVWSLARRSGR
ncbi:enoyl-CoA hydratase/isomerase family protein [Nocardia xishanensis]|uniref:Enoyl-CoA hydratase/isomerase family protein n=1 Tax=Nocardia xishanensis TaxID=238964 RepID=A0ABW7XBP2_9NOCA